MNRSKKLFSLILACIITMTSIPIGDLIAYAANDGEMVLEEIEMIVMMDETGDIVEGRLSITGMNIKDVEVFAEGTAGVESKKLVPTVSGKTYVSYDRIPAENLRVGLKVDGKPIYEKGGMPLVKDFSPRNLTTEGGSENEISITGSGFDLIGKGVDGFLESDKYEVDLKNGEIEDNEIKFFVGIPGVWKIVFEKIKEENEASKEPNIIIRHEYHDAFRVSGVLDVGDVDMVPTRGPLGTVVSLTDDENKIKGLSSNLSIFMVKDLSEKLTENHMIKEIRTGGIQGETIVFDVPKSLETVYGKGNVAGEYYVILTNKVNKVDNIEYEIKKRKVLNHNFLLTTAGDGMVIQKIAPEYGPASGKEEAKIYGNNIFKLSSNVYEPGNENKDPEITVEGNSIKVEYTGGKYKISESSGFVPIIKMTREIFTTVGLPTGFQGKDDQQIEDKEILGIITPERTDLEADKAEDVIVRVDTKIELKEEKPKVINFTEEAALKNGYTFLKTDYEPKNIEVVPYLIPLDDIEDGKRKLKPQKIQLIITGENFVIHSYKDDDGKTHIKYPVIDIADGDIVINKNFVEGRKYWEKDDDDDEFDFIHPDLVEMAVYNDGQLLTGVRGNNVGNKIVVTIPDKPKAASVLANKLNLEQEIESDLIVTNPSMNDRPIKISETDEKQELTNMGLYGTGKVRFVVDRNPPVINDIKPSIVPLDGHEEAIISGSNFDKDIKVYLDGEEIQNAERNSVGTQIKIDLPPKPAGEYVLMVQNEKGGISLTKVNYIKAYTDIKINEFNPQKGGMETLVTVKGNGFLRPVNTKISDVKGVESRKLIGTTVYLGDDDINEYNTNSEGYIKLIPFKDENLWRLIKDEEVVVLEMADHYHSVILANEGKQQYFSIYYDYVTGEYKLSDSVETYTLVAREVEGEKKLYGVKNNKEFKITNNGEVVELDGKKLKIMTPYKVEENEIVGNRVKVISENELIFRVPHKGNSRRRFDVTVENPDTIKDSKKGNDGFLYFPPSDYTIGIDKIVPNEGSEEGGYFIEIVGDMKDPQNPGFIDNGGEDKAVVVIGSVVVPSEDVQISADGRRITVKVPAYPGDLESEISTDRKTVPVVVVNPDGVNASVEKGFSYVVPRSNPKISNVYLKSGSAAGGDVVVIEGSDFRYFEPYEDANKNGKYDFGEKFRDLNKNKEWDNLRNGYVYIGGIKTYLTDIKNDEANGAELWEQYVEPILPKIYFGKEKAKIVNFEQGKIEVETPKATKGTIGVYLVNNDYGRSNEMPFIYETSNPSITAIAPSVGSYEGGQAIEILGQNFSPSSIEIVKDKDKTDQKEMHLVRFGKVDGQGNPVDKNMSNGTVRPGDLNELGIDNSGKIEYNEAEVNVGDLNVRYNAKNPDKKFLDFTIKSGSGKEEKTYNFKYENYNEEDIYIPINKLIQVDERNRPIKDENEKNIPYGGKELVKVSLEHVEGSHAIRRLRVDRGYAPETDLVRDGQIKLTLPSFYTVADVEATVINPDDEKASEGFRYRNPASKPVITNILRNDEPGYEVDDGRTIVEVSHKGGSRIAIEGIDFRKPVTLKIGGVIDVEQAELTYLPEASTISNRIEFDMKEVDVQYVNSGPLRVSLANEDGGSTVSDPFFIKFIKPETINMRVDKIEPDSGPTKGGTTVTIHGADFRETIKNYPNKRLKVFFKRGGELVEVPRENFISIDYDKIILKTPPFTAGATDVIIENPDGNTVTLLGGFTYTSNPIISSVVDPEFEDAPIHNISVEGGERIKILGNDFVETPRVIFNPKLREVKDGVQETGEIININGKQYVLESGLEGRDVEFLDRQTLLVTTPEAKIGDRGVLVINPDGGASNIYDLEYGIPQVGAPLDVRAELVYDEFIRVNWQGVRNALEYEVYVSVNGRAFEYVGSTELTSFVYRDIKPRTDYKFLVRALGEYGSSDPIEESESNTVTTGRTAGPKDEDGYLGENTTVDRQGDNVHVILGERDYSSSGIRIDLTRGNLAGAKSVTVRMPARVITDSFAGEVQILAKDWTMRFKPSSFGNTTVYNNRNNDKAGVVFKIDPYSGPTTSQDGRMLGGPAYRLEASTYVGKNSSNMDLINGSIDFILDSNPMIVNSRNLRNLGLSVFNDRTKSWDISPMVSKMGIYAITGSRR